MIEKKFILSYLENNCFDKKVKKSILCLENYFFYSFIIEIENVINNEDREDKIQDRLEGIFSKYDSSKYLLRYEKVSTNKKSEKLAVYLLDLDLLDETSTTHNMKNLKYVSIIPSFLKCREFNQSPNFFNFDISKKAIFVSKYVNKSLEDISIYQISANDEVIFKENYSSIINNYLESVADTYSIVFTGEKIDADILTLENKKFYIFNTEKFHIYKSPNFLPDDLKNIYTYFYTNTAYILVLFIFSILMLFSTILLNYKIHNLENIFVDIQVKRATVEDEISNAREKIVEIEKLKLQLQKELEKNKSNNLKLDFLLNFLTNIADNIKIKSIENDKNSIINIVGTSYENKNIIKFLKKIEETKYFQLVNYDYIVNTENIFEFKAEIKYIDN